MSIILIIAPHPDDEVLGCGGTIKKKTLAGDQVYLCIATEAYTPEWSKKFIAKRFLEVKKANAILGIKKTFFLKFPTVKLDTMSQKKLNDALQNVVQEVRPDTIYLPHRGDLNADHRIVHEAGLVAARPLPGTSVRTVLSYETLSETEWGVEEFRPMLYEDVKGTFKSKLTAMKAYSSELHPFPHPRSVKAIEALAEKRGSEAGRFAAEAFILIRALHG